MKRVQRKLKSPKSCRYCGFVCVTHVREGNGGAAASVTSYSCRDADACGERIRAKRTPCEREAIQNSYLPF